MKPRKGRVVYVVSVPWDSASVKETHVFKNEKDADKFLTKINEDGYGGFCGGLFVEEVAIK